MNELIYVELPTPDTAAVCTWLQQEWHCELGKKIITPDGIRVQLIPTLSRNATTSAAAPIPEISIFIWSVQRTTYLKAFRWGESAIPGEGELLQALTRDLRRQFPYHYPKPPIIDLSEQSIFEALAPYYPQTVRFFQKMPNGEYDLNRVYWWEQRWREGVRNPQQPKQVVFEGLGTRTPMPTYDIIYIGGALGVIHAAVMAQRGYKVLLVERLPFGRMNREWNISRDEFQSLIDLGLFTPTEFESIIAKEYIDGFNKFFDGNNPSYLKAPVLHTPKVLNVALDSEKLLQMCGEKLRQAGGEIWDETEFIRADITPEQVIVSLQHLPTRSNKQATGQLLVDAMGTASPIAWQLNGGRAFDSVCPTVGAVIASGFEPGVWDSNYGDVLYSHGDISRGRQLIWELFPGAGAELTIYLFHYHQVNSQNPGSLLEMYEDFFTILPEYRRCDMEKLVWKKPTFGYIPGHFTVGSGDRTVAFDRLITIGDAASLQSPLVFTGFGSLVRNLYRLTDLLDTALRHNLLGAKDLNQIRAYQSNISVTWLFSKGMMVPTGSHLPPQRINAMLNTFFGLLADEPLEVADNFIKDRFDWLTFNRLALKAARRNPALILWIWEMAGVRDLWRWVGSYLSFSRQSLVSGLLRGWFPSLIRRLQPWIEEHYAAFWLRLLAQHYALTTGMGRPEKVRREGFSIKSGELIANSTQGKAFDS
ncbi:MULTISPECIES: NAD(P)/FAD-dependent oxidoreductase [unclassified Coleofasciculus]|uniref:NAD(P)/FAD-dependent oxidoreductase n=1 Tax=unclassified Coleofasciculus TaxID=2692782 RepID=UPI00187E3737|nr:MULTISPECIES: flavin-dependent dehydrogenase [unclassified Coleofasciculus]MBE9129238.1 flavin-dependent dehydrogenase [Coleofasciculus sp. LEGE 07081]MBE9148253.1 flavin-dependent dehydrogenase [Coleofasciculus sp. LEGE 07092]